MEPAYPSVDQIVEYNVLVLNVIKVKKADAPHVLSREKLAHAIAECRKTDGGLYKKAAVLMRALVKAHAFASGNRRTAFVAAKGFVLANNGRFAIKDEPSYAKAMLGIREGYYSDNEMAEWIKDGKIREFKR